MDDSTPIVPAPTGEASALPEIAAAAELELPPAAAVIDPGEVPLMPAGIGDVVEGMLDAADAPPLYWQGNVRCASCGFVHQVAIGVLPMTPCDDTIPYPCTSCPAGTRQLMARQVPG